MSRASVLQTYIVALDDGDEFTIKLKFPDITAWEAEHRLNYLTEGATTQAGQMWVAWRACRRIGAFVGSLDEFKDHVTEFALHVQDGEGPNPPAPFTRSSSEASVTG